MNNVRCPTCKGAKQMMKLGGMLGNCNLCNGKGEVNEKDVPIVVKPKIELVPNEIINQVSNVQPISNVEPEIKIDGKKAIYKRKTIAK